MAGSGLRPSKRLTGSSSARTRGICGSRVRRVDPGKRICNKCSQIFTLCERRRESRWLDDVFCVGLFRDLLGFDVCLWVDHWVDH